MRKLQFTKIDSRLRSSVECTEAGRDIKRILGLGLAVIVGIGAYKIGHFECTEAWYGLWIGGVPHLHNPADHLSLAMLVALAGGAVLSATIAAVLRRPFLKAEHYRHVF